MTTPQFARGGIVGPPHTVTLTAHDQRHVRASCTCGVSMVNLLPWAAASRLMFEHMRDPDAELLDPSAKALQQRYQERSITDPM